MPTIRDVAVELLDSDDDSIGDVRITSRVMLEAEASGDDPFAIDTTLGTAGLIQRVVFTVSSQ